LYNVVLVIAYQGTFFKGFQSQPNQRTVYDTVVQALNEIYKEPVKCSFSGRTDSGVHAAEQHMNFETTQYIPSEGLLRAAQSLLPGDIQCRAVFYAEAEFDARFSACSREYRYRFSLEPVSVVLRPYVYELNGNVDLNVLNRLGQMLLGTHDFAGFSCEGSEVTTTLRTLYYFEVKEKVILDLVNSDKARYYEVVIIGNSFLYKMVRNIIGALFSVCSDTLTESAFKQIIANGTRSHHYQTVSPVGLCLSRVNY